MPFLRLPYHNNCLLESLRIPLNDDIANVRAAVVIVLAIDLEGISGKPLASTNGILNNFMF